MMLKKKKERTISSINKLICLNKDSTFNLGQKSWRFESGEIFRIIFKYEHQLNIIENIKSKDKFKVGDKQLAESFKNVTTLIVLQHFNINGFALIKNEEWLLTRFGETDFDIFNEKRKIRILLNNSFHQKFKNK